MILPHKYVSSSCGRLCRSILSNVWNSQRCVLRTHKTAGILVIGDEVLKGQVHDTNSGFLAKELHKRGYKLQAINVIPDEVNTIRDFVQNFSKTYDIVLTTGGIGPTHDDVTYEAVALAFNDSLHHHPSLLEICRMHFKTIDESHPGLKLALIPKMSKLTYGKDESGSLSFWLPVASVKNVVLFPGVPHLCERLFITTCSQLFPVESQFYVRHVYVNTVESKLTPKLNEAVKNFPTVIFGSYPKFFHSYYIVKITLQSDTESDVNEAVNFLVKEMPWVVDYDDNIFHNSLEKLNKLSNKNLIKTIPKIEKLLRMNSNENLFLYFDGGKNSTVLLHLLSVLSCGKPLNVIYIERDKKITSFVLDAAKSYKVNILKLDEINFERLIRSDPEIVLIKGTRSTDPNADQILSYFSKFKTINPLSDWSYSDVWEVIRGLYLPYCSLYNQGYSSLSKSVNVRLVTDGPRKDVTYFKSAYLLDDPKFE